MKINDILAEGSKNWSGGKHPGDMSEREFIDHHYTGFIDDSTYTGMSNPESDRWQKEANHMHPKVVGKKTFGDKKIEFRKSIDENKYTKTIYSGPDDAFGNLARDSAGKLIYMTRNEMRKKGLAIYDQTIFAFHGDEYVALASNEFGAIGIWVRDDYQGSGIGSFLLKLFMKENPHMQIGQMTEMGYGMARKVWELFYKDQHGIAPGSKPDDGTLREDETDHINALNNTGFWGKQGAGCIFYSTATNRYLIAHRSNMVEEPGTWGTWGGAMDAGEKPMQTVAREIKEEAGYNGLTDIRYVWTFQHESGFKYHNYIAIVEDEFTPILNWETQGYSWVTLKHLPNPMHTGLVGLLQRPEFFRIMSNL